MGPYQVRERQMVRQLLPSLQSEMLCLADRALHSFQLWQQAQATGAACFGEFELTTDSKSARGSRTAPTWLTFAAVGAVCGAASSSWLLGPVPKLGRGHLAASADVLSRQKVPSAAAPAPTGAVNGQRMCKLAKGFRQLQTMKSVPRGNSLRSQVVRLTQSFTFRGRRCNSISDEDWV